MPPPPGAYVEPSAPIGDYRMPLQGANPRYATSDYADHAFLDSPSGAWSPSLRLSPDGTPDASRNQAIPLRDYRPDARQAPALWWDGVRGPGHDENVRHRTAETIDADGRRMWRGDMGRKRSAPDLRRTPPPEPRVTNAASPSSYMFTRPFDQTMRRQFNGQHFSMADHRRNYDIYGMAPVTSRRNTYRVDPPPWDEAIIDTQSYAIVPVDVPDSAGRAWRL